MTDPYKMPENPEERTETEFRSRMRSRKAREDARDRFIQKELGYYRKRNKNLTISFMVVSLIYSIIIIYFLST